VVETRDRKIIIDPGLALGYKRFGLLPHPFQVAVGEKVREKIIRELKDSTDVIISHFHGDHIPLANANPYQLDAKKVPDSFKKSRFWCKGGEGVSYIMRERRRYLSYLLGYSLPNSEGKTDGILRFSGPLFHGEPHSRTGTVMMTRIEEEKVFVHASDIQLLHSEAVNQVLNWHPHIVLVSGPPLYLQYMAKEKRERAWDNAVRLSKGVNVLILDHHLLRSQEGYDLLRKIESKTGNRVMCAAEFMGKRPLLLEAKRKLLYKEMPVSNGWHNQYALGRVDTSKYRVWRGYHVDKN